MPEEKRSPCVYCSPDEPCHNHANMTLPLDEVNAMRALGFDMGIVRNADATSVILFVPQASFPASHRPVKHRAGTLRPVEVVAPGECAGPPGDSVPVLIPIERAEFVIAWMQEAVDKARARRWLS